MRDFSSFNNEKADFIINTIKSAFSFIYLIVQISHDLKSLLNNLVLYVRNTVYPFDG